MSKINLIVEYNGSSLIETGILKNNESIFFKEIYQYLTLQNVKDFQIGDVISVSLSMIGKEPNIENNDLKLIMRLSVDEELISDIQLELPSDFNGSFSFKHKI